MTDSQAYLVSLLRNFLTMQYERAVGSSYELKQKLGDEELLLDLRNGLSLFNITPPLIDPITYDDLYKVAQDSDNPLAPEIEDDKSIFISSILMCALFYTGLRLQWFEAGKHFRFSDNGISIERAKLSEYNMFEQQIMTHIQNLGVIKTHFAMKKIRMKGLFSGTIAYPRAITRALRGTRLGRI